MISIIIASVNAQQLNDIRINIEETVGIPYEILVFNNANGHKGLCEIYNLGAKQAKYDLLCYMHEDISIKTRNWGQIVLSAFAEITKLGLIGIAGSSYKSIAPSGWFCNGGPAKINYINILQRFKFDQLGTSHHLQNPKNEKISQVVAVDGVWFCTTKTCVTKYPFDEVTFKKFHCYDIDYSLAIRNEYKAYVTFEILLEHFSEGNYDSNWVEETLKLHNKWANSLPVNLENLSEKEMKITEKHAFRFFFKRMQITGYSKIQRIKVLLKSKLSKKIGTGIFLKLLFEA
ncbi:glycosyltransferase [Pedobacter rhodius]|uniref:Glycosyltransferase n=1 Tax=Pedobacter rhodius TaxID=3004098 RepID=A0ABT4KXW3_9SPHI|nr:glycosyltransferase [Pedobacter sp. SJ11]MCZ4223761.1 glycosyltransferase [Pedobacter sp. SJ11]